VVEPDDLLAAMRSAFAVTGAAFPGWPDPHAGGSPADDEYSRVSEPGRYLILGARVEAWLEALTGFGLADVERGAEPVWVQAPGSVISRVDRVVPRATGALPLVVARSGLGDVDDAGVTLGVGDPAVCVTYVPDCGCDACDAGSDWELERLDENLLAVVSGTYRQLRRGDSLIEVLNENGWSAQGLRRRDRVEAVLADPRGWDELSGSSWLAA
jgi:hypothetical protein